MCVLAENSGSNVEGSSGFRDVFPNRKHLTLPELRSQSALDERVARPQKAYAVQSLFHGVHVDLATVLGRVHLRDGQLSQSSRASE